MLKLLGSACILAGGVLAQGARLAERRRQWDTLSDLLFALRRMEEEIRLTQTPMPVLLEGLAKDRGADAASFFTHVAEALRRGDLPGDVWRREAAGLPLPPEALRALEDLGGALGGDEEDTCKAIGLAVYELAKCAEEHARDRKAEDRRAAALYFSGAALLVILLI